jgi:phosphohistidine phosphatase SixA
MKIFIALLFVISGLFLTSDEAFGQHKKMTVILFRHAEKDLTNPNDPNPQLSAEGNLRAEKLIGIVNKYNPDVIYSTDYIRTRSTVRPLARSRRAMTLIYDPRNLQQMRDLVLSGKFQRIVIVGHNNTTPALVNMLTNQDKYKTLPETEYGKMWIVKIKKNKKKQNKVSEQMITY